jgi:uroporphyrinogen-III synthase
VASPSALAGLLDAVGAERITRALVVATGPTTAAAVARVLGTAPLVAAAPDAAAVVDALAEGFGVVAR